MLCYVIYVMFCYVMLCMELSCFRCTLHGLVAMVCSVSELTYEIMNKWPVAKRRNTEKHRYTPTRPILRGHRDRQKWIVEKLG